MGQDYTVSSGYYGGFPHGYTKRIMALFPDIFNDATPREKILHLFSGKIDTQEFPGMTVDINPELKPDYVDDAQRLEKVPLENFIFADGDPPYSVEDAEHYKATMVKRNLVFKALGSRLPVGAFVVWLDQVEPMYRKDQFKIVAAIGMVKSTNHRFRMVLIFERV